MSLHDDLDLDLTLCADHDEYFDCVCDPCAIEKRNVQAIGHCINCIQNVCNDCIKSHKKLAGLMSHVLENKPKGITGKGAQSDAKNTDPLKDHCNTHPDELIKFNCNIHNTLACDGCLALHHRTCEEVVDIQDISGGIENSEELNTLQLGLRRLEETLAKYKTDTEKIQNDFIEKYASIVKKIKEWRTGIDRVLNKLEEKLLEKASSTKEYYMSYLTNNSSSCDDMVTKMKRLLSDLDDKMKSGHHNSLYIAVRQDQETLVKLQQEAALIRDQCKARHLCFQPHEKIDTYLSTLGLGTVYLSGEPEKIKAKNECDLNVKSYTDKKNCLISGATALPDNRLCLCDNTNKAIKIVDTTNMKMTEQLILSAEPIDIAMISQNELAVTIKGDKTLHILSTSPTLRPSRTLRLPELYNGITYYDDKLLLTCWNGDYGVVDICDMSGYRIKRIKTNVDGTNIFILPSKICANPDLSMMYVTNHNRHSVVCMNTDGDVINVYRNEKLKSPTGITVDKDVNVYVCSKSNHTIHQLTPTGQLVQILLEQKDLFKFPDVIAFMSGYLYISSSTKYPVNRNKVKVFRLAQKW